MILPIYASLERIDLSLIEAAKDLYASARQAFLRVTLPLTAPGIVAGVLLTFIPAFGDYVNAELLGGPNQAMIGNKIQSLYLSERNYPEAAALSFLMMAAILIVVLVYIRARRDRGVHGRARRSADADGARAWAWLRRNALMIYAGLRGRLHADPDRRDRHLLVRARRRRDKLNFAISERLHARVLGERLLGRRS